MSHVASVEVEVRDLDALRAAADRVGLEFVEGQRAYRWYGRFLNDWPSHRAAVNKGVDPATFGRCDHALRLKDGTGVDYEVGVTAQADGSYRLVYDSFGAGRRLEQAAGVDLARLRDEVAAETASRHLQSRGWSVQRVEDDDGISIYARG